MRRILKALTASMALAWLVIAPAGPAVADWLVTREGARLETKGSWEVKGRTVVFTLANGSLSSMRLDEVDLEASEEATAAALRPPPPPSPPPPPPPPARFVITDDDVGRARPSAAPSGDSDGAAPAAPSSAAPSLEVTRWDQEYSSTAGGLEIHGALRNAGQSALVQVGLRITLLDSDGTEIASGNAFLARSALPVGLATEFRWLAEGVGLFSDIRFEPSGSEVFLGIAEPSDADEESEGDAESSEDG